MVDCGVRQENREDEDWQGEKEAENLAIEAVSEAFYDEFQPRFDNILRVMIA